MLTSFANFDKSDQNFTSLILSNYGNMTLKVIKGPEMIPFGPQKLSHCLAWDPHSHGDPHSPCYLPKARTLIVIAGWPEQPGTLIVIGTLIVVYLLPITTGTLIVLTK